MATVEPAIGQALQRTLCGGGAGRWAGMAAALGGWAAVVFAVALITLAGLAADALWWWNLPLGRHGCGAGQPGSDGCSSGDGGGAQDPRHGLPVRGEDAPGPDVVVKYAPILLRLARTRRSCCECWCGL